MASHTPAFRSESRADPVIPALASDRRLALGVAWGVAAWSSFAVVEYFLSGIWPLLTTDQAIITPVNWQANAWLFTAYWVLGAIAGLMSAMLASRLPAASSPDVSARDWGKLTGSISLYLAILVHLIVMREWKLAELSVLALDLVLLAGTLWCLARRTTRLMPWFAVHPLVGAFLVIGPAWFSADVAGGMTILPKRILLVFLIGGVVVLGRLTSHFTWGAGRQLAINLILLTALVGGTAFLNGRNRVLPPIPASAGTPGLTPVILFSFDTTRADHLSVYGYPHKTTPHLEEFARGATLYRDAVAASDMTLSSHGSIFTGVYSSWHGGHSYSASPSIIRALPKTLPTLAEMLRDRGYFTTGVAANSAFLMPEWGLTRGFQSFDVQPPVEVLPLLRLFYPRHSLRRLLSCCIDTLQFDAQYRDANQVDDDALGIAGDPRAQSRSLFLFVNYMDAHSPFVANVPSGYGLPAGDGAPNLVQYYRLAEDLMRYRKPISQAVRDRLVERYDAGIAAEDEAFDRIMEWLKSRGIYDRAMIIVTSDHGEALGEHDLAFHGVGVYQHQVHVPLLIKYPNQTMAAVVDTPVSHIDILPTILETLGMKIPDHVQGRSLVNPTALGDRVLYAESFPSNMFPKPVPRLDRTERLIRSGSLELITSTIGKHEIFDLATDPGELHNLSATAPERAAGMETMLRDWIKSLPAQPATDKGSDEQMRRLKGLGYVH